MIARSKELFEQHRQFLLYAMIGVSGVVLDLILFFVLFNLFQIDKNLATFMSTSAGITNNFLWNAFVNFKTSDQLAKRFGQFYLVGLSGIVLTVAIFFVFVDQLHLNANLVKVGSLPPVLVMQFLLNKYWTFK
jgi:putative flippase GtrA